MISMNTAQNPGRRYGGASATERQTQRRAELIAAGTQIIGTEGFQTATVRAVCQQARLTERYFYESFSSREDLLMAVYRNSVAQLSARLARSVQGAPRSAQAMTRAAVTAVLWWLRDDPRQARIIYFEMMGSSETLGHVFLEYTQGFADLVLGLLAPLMASRLPKGYDKDVMAAAVVGVFNHMVLWWALTDYEKPLEEMVDDCVSIFLTLINPAMKTPTPSKKGSAP